MKLFYSEEIRRLEEQAVQEGVSMETLMENAGAALAREAGNRCGPLAGKRAVLLCGKGNNGGDGFVCARHLAEQGAVCTVLLVQGEPKTELARKAFLSMPDMVECLCAEQQCEEAGQAIKRADLLLDCVFGFGFRGELSGTPAYFLKLANSCDCLKIACDLPSGVECDTGRASIDAFRADATVTFTGKKPACVSYPAREYCGEAVTAEVGIPRELTEGAKTGLLETDVPFVKKFLPQLHIQCNKGDLGRLLLVCGSYGMAGACVMAARAALRCGVGLLHIAVDERIYPIVAQAVPEAVFTILPWECNRAECEKRLSAALHTASACLLGCGLGEMAETVCPLVLENCRVPMVIDADGLNFLARHSGEAKAWKAPVVLTPHPGEMARLTGKPIPEIQGNRLKTAREASRRWGAVTVLKGAGTVTASPEGKGAVNPTGNPGMAKGGSGDVLAGMIASLLAQGVPAFEAAACGVYLHGKAGDLCAGKLSQRAMLPTDLIGSLPEVFRAF